MNKIMIAAVYLFTSLAFAQTPPPVSLRGSPGVVNSPAWNLQVPLNQATKTGGISALIETGNYNILSNPNFEHLTFNTDWSATGGVVIQGINVALGSKSANWDPSAAGQFFSSALATIPQGLAGTNGEAFCRYQTSATDLAFSVLDGSGNTLGTVNPIAATTSGWATARVNFVFPPVSGSGTAQVRFSSASNSSDINVDDCYLGPATNIGTVAQATIFATATLPATNTASCGFSQNTSTSENNYVSLAGASGCPAWVSSGPISMTTNTLHATFNNLPAGEYEVSLSAPFVNNSGNTVCNFRFSDGTTGFGSNFVYTSAGGVLSNGTMIGRISYSAPQTSVTWSVQASDSGVTTCSVSPDTLGRSANWIIKRFPSSSELAFRPDLQNYYLDLNISGANISLPTSGNVSTYTTPNNASLTMTINSSKGSQSAGISCSSTNDNSVGSTTCSVGNEEPGFVANLPRAGLFEVCGYFSHGVAATGASTAVDMTFQWIRTANGSQTVVEEGGAKITSSLAVTVQAPRVDNLFPHTNCGTFQIPSAGKHTFRLMYEQTTSGTLNANFLTSDGLATQGNRDIKITARYIDQQIPRPVLVGSVSSGSVGQERVERARIALAASPTISNASSSWITPNSRTGTGDNTFNIVGFTSTPVCHCTGFTSSADTAQYVCNLELSASSSSILRIKTRQFTTVPASNAFDATVDLTCTGPRN